MKYIALSDLHLGQTGKDNTGEISLLSCGADMPEADRKIDSLGSTIRDFAGSSPVSLILVGDVLDLSLAYMETALKDFASLLSKLPVIHNIIYVVGNHDHHIWTMHCEHINVIDRLNKGFLPKSGSIYRRTKLDGEKFSLFEKFLNNPNVSIAYPMYCMADKNLYFTHGHLFGGLYTFISDILEPFLPEGSSHLDTVATVNISVIEFIYWLLGETGQGMGADGIMEAIYMDSQKGKKSKLYTALKSAIEVLLPNGIIAGFPDAWEHALAVWVGKHIIDETVKEPKPLSSMDRHKPSEKSRELAIKWTDNTICDSPLKLVVGHTHVSDYFVKDKFEMFNLGGWLIDEREPEPDSNILLIDDNKLELKKVE